MYTICFSMKALLIIHTVCLIIPYDFHKKQQLIPTHQLAGVYNV
jgi:hypothetical protein